MSAPAITADALRRAQHAADEVLQVEVRRAAAIRDRSPDKVLAWDQVRRWYREPAWRDRPDALVGQLLASAILRLVGAQCPRPAIFRSQVGPALAVTVDDGYRINIQTPAGSYTVSNVGALTDALDRAETLVRLAEEQEDRT
jgi:hypothetical protein